MRNLRIIPIFAITIFLLTGCLKLNFEKISEVPFFLISHKKIEGAKEIGCGDYLVQVKEKISGEPSVEKALKLFFGADPKQYGQGLETAEDFKSKYIVLELTAYQKLGTIDGIVISLVTNKNIGTAGHCDIPRVKEQIIETVRANAASKPFLIWLDGSIKAWECFGDESGKCL